MSTAIRQGLTNDAFPGGDAGRRAVVRPSRRPLRGFLRMRSFLMPSITYLILRSVPKGRVSKDARRATGPAYIAPAIRVARRFAYALALGPVGAGTSGSRTLARRISQSHASPPIW